MSWKPLMKLIKIIFYPYSKLNTNCWSDCNGVVGWVNDQKSKLVGWFDVVTILSNKHTGKSMNWDEKRAI
jgi:hypothetical protein